MLSGEIVIPKVWRSEFLRLALFGIFSLGAVILSRAFPQSVLNEMIPIWGSRTLIVSLPLFWLLPAVVLGSAILKIYNVRYSIDHHGIESRVGVLSFRQTTTRIRFEDIRSIETHQTIVERVLDVGTLEMGTAASEGLEMVFHGIGSPVEVQRLIQSERDARVKEMLQGEGEYSSGILQLGEPSKQRAVG